MADEEKQAKAGSIQENPMLLLWNAIGALRADVSELRQVVWDMSDGLYRRKLRQRKPSAEEEEVDPLEKMWLTYIENQLKKQGISTKTEPQP